MTEIKIQDDSGDKDFFTILPNYIANHSTANDQSLYFQMKRYAGEDGKCFATEKTLMKKMGIGKKSYNKSLNYLLEKGWISFVGLTEGKTRPIKTYKINNIWKLNNETYKKISSESTLSFQEISSESRGDKFQKNTKISSESNVEEEPLEKEHKEDIGLAKPTKRKEETFKKENYDNILKEFQFLKGVVLQGNEFLPVQQAIKTMLISKRSVEDIIGCMRWLADKASSGEKKWEWTQNWTIKTVQLKLPEFLGGKLEKTEEFQVPEYAKGWIK